MKCGSRERGLNAQMKSSVLLHGQGGGFFRSSRGLGQDDPFTLIIIVMDSLSPHLFALNGGRNLNDLNIRLLTATVFST